jgi:sRNA-binding carbon storage regulator CsrA
MSKTKTEKQGMLALMRKCGQKVFVTLPDGRRGVVQVVWVQGENVKLGMAFPKDVTIEREEIVSI